MIAGAPPETFRVPADEIGRRRALGLPEGFVLFRGAPVASSGLALGLRAVARAAIDLPVVILDAPEGSEPALAELAAAAGIPESHVHVRPALDPHDRAAVFGAAVAYVATAVGSAFPWRLVEALRLGVPVVAVDSAVHREVLAEGVSWPRSTRMPWVRRSPPRSGRRPLRNAWGCSRGTAVARSRGRARRNGCGSCTPTSEPSRNGVSEHEFLNRSGNGS